MQSRGAIMPLWPPICLPATIGQDVFGQFNVELRLTGNAAAR
jgi:hypothetical protein